jgi:hypothetical protein
LGVCLNSLDPKAVRVELYANGVRGKAPICQEVQHAGQLPASPGCHSCSATVRAERAAADYTVRLIPYYDGVAIPLEEARIFVAAIMQFPPRELHDCNSHPSDHADFWNPGRGRRGRRGVPVRTIDLDSKCDRTGYV